MTAFEIEFVAVIRTAIDYLTRQKVERGEYMALMGLLRDASKKGECLELGCPMGLHLEECTCQENKKGENFHVYKTRLARIRKGGDFK